MPLSPIGLGLCMSGVRKSVRNPPEDRIVIVEHVQRGREGMFLYLAETRAVSGYCSDSHSLSLPNRRLFKEYEICYTDAGHWKIFDHPFVEGGPFSEADFQSGIPKMVLSEQVATDLFGTGQAVGRQVVMDFITFTVCGVVRDVPSSLMGSYAQVWIPYSSNEALTV